MTSLRKSDDVKTRFIGTVILEKTRTKRQVLIAKVVRGLFISSQETLLSVLNDWFGSTSSSERCLTYIVYHLFCESMCDKGKVI